MTIAGDQLRVVWKNPCRVATTADVATLVGGAPSTVDGVSVVANDRILVWQQSTGSQNGVYVVTTVGSGANGTWTRAADFDNAAADAITAGVMTYVQDGTIWGGNRFTLTTTGAITVGVTTLTFTQDSNQPRLVWKNPCRLATTGNIASIAGGAPNSVDGVSLVVNDRILVWQQTAGAQVGIYVVTTVGSGANGTWTRASDFSDATADFIVAGVTTYVQEGSAWGGIRFILTTTGAITIGVTSLTFTPEGGLARTDASSTEITAPIAFNAATIIWSSAVSMRDHSSVSVWFMPTDIGSNTQVDLLAQWSDDGSTIPFDDNNGIQQTDFIIAQGTDGTFAPKDYMARLTTGAGELATNKFISMTYPKRGGSFRFGVRGDNSSGTFSVRSQRLAG